MSTLLVVDDEPSICWGLTQLGEEMGHQVWTASSAEQALDLLERKNPDVIVLDVRLPGMSGLQAMEKFQRRCADAPIIVVTAYGDLETAVTAVRNGAFEYIVKPFDLEMVQRALTRALSVRMISETSPSPTSVGGLVGRSSAMQDVFKRIALAAASDISVLVCGESGTGKELAARAIHRYGDRANRPFVAVNVAALSPSLAEAELFGHVRGAFTGADRDHIGLLVQANGGTLFLDEVADIPLPTQAKLLRAVEHKEVLPIGGSKATQTDFRIISATHQDLLAKVQQGTFRHDLYFRLCAFEVVMPALRDRPEDIAELANHFLESAVRGRGTVPQLSPEVIVELSRRHWSGNVRELRNAVDHAATIARGGVIELEHLPPPLAGFESPAVGNTPVEKSLAQLVGQWTADKLKIGSEIDDLHRQLMRVVEPPLLATTLERHRQQCATAARTLGMHRTTLRKMLDDYGIEEK